MSAVLDHLRKLKPSSDMIARLPARAWVTLRDMVLPPTCLSCDAGVDVQGTVCPTCWSSIRFIEKPYCKVFGSPFAYDLGAGALSAQAIADPPKFTKARAAVLYDDAARRMVQGLKFSDRTELAPWMARWMVRASDGMLDGKPLVVPVPLHKQRLRSRRFNQSAELARAIARQCELPYRPDVLIRSRPTRQQVGLGSRERAKNVAGAFRLPKGMGIAVKGRDVVLVDDVYTTGATVAACTRPLLRAGASSISVLTFARVANGVAVTEL